MTDAGRTAPGCLDAETLAALVDGRLDAAARVRAEAHIAECEDCYEAFVETVRLGEQIAVATPAVAATVPPKRGATGWVVIGVGLAAAALVVVMIQPAWLARLVHPGVRPDVAELVAAVGANRPAEGRLTGGFKWGPAPSATRSGSSSPAVTPELQIAAAHLEQTLQKTRTPQTLSAFASAALAIGKTDDAVRALEEATALSKDTASLWSDLSAAYLARAKRDGQAVDLPRSLEAAETAASLDAALPEALFNRALALERLSLKAQAIDAWKRYLTIDPSSPWAAEARERLEALTRVSDARPDAQDLRERLFDDVLGRWGSSLRADPASAQRQIADAQSIVQELGALSSEPLARDVVAVVAATAPGPTRDLLADGHAAYGRARVDYLAAKTAEAWVEFDRAERSLSAARSPLALWATLYKGIALFRKGDLSGSSNAIAAFDRTIAGGPYESLTGKTSWMLGLLAQMRGDFGEADTEFARAAHLLHAAGELANEAFVDGMIAERFDWLGDPRRAWDVRLASLERERHSTGMLAGALAASASGWPHVADAFQASALQAARTSRERIDLPDVLRNQAVRRAAVGDFAAAKRHLADAQAALHALPDQGGDRTRAEFDLSEAKCSDADDAETGIQAATRALAYFSAHGLTGRLSGIYAVRAGLYRLRHDDDRAQADLERGLDALAAQRPTVIGSDLRATFGDEVRQVSDALVRLELDRGRDDRAFDVAEYGRSWDLAGTTSPRPREGALQSLSAALPTGATAVVFVVFDQETLAWTVNRSSARLHRLRIDREELTRLVSAFAGSGMTASVGVRLRDLLLAPLEQDVKSGDFLILLPDGPLHLLPFAGLPGSHASSLAEEHPILVTPSVALLLRASQHASTFKALPSQILAIGNPRFDPASFPSLPALPEAEAEAASVARAYAHPTVLLGAEATRSTFLALLPGTEVVHFAGHALVNEQEPLRSQLVLWNGNGPGATAHDVELLTCSRTRLVVLAACDSASGLVTRSAGPVGLAKSFLAAGVPAILASYGVVNDKATRLLFEQFHQEFRRSGNPVTALRAAQLALLRSTDAEMRRPTSWANFVAIGGVDLSTNGSL